MFSDQDVPPWTARQLQPAADAGGSDDDVGRACCLMRT